MRARSQWGLHIQTRNTIYTCTYFTRESDWIHSMQHNSPLQAETHFSLLIHQYNFGTFLCPLYESMARQHLHPNLLSLCTRKFWFLLKINCLDLCVSKDKPEVTSQSTEKAKHAQGKTAERHVLLQPRAARWGEGLTAAARVTACSAELPTC
jgi:hypothetical protein